jgi:DNA-binding NarL/FixJ family response regulator
LQDVPRSPGHDTKVNKALALDVGERLLLAIDRSQWDQAEALATQVTAVLRRLATNQDSRTPAVPSLTRAELRLLPLLATHLTFREIGAKLSLSPNTVKSQAISIYRKLGVSSRGEVIPRARELGFLE